MKVAVVTGSNKGIGLAIVRGLCKQFDGDVYLTARDEGRGTEAVQKLKEEGLKPKFHQLDITDSDSITRLKEFLQSKYQGLDLLVNNAGFAYKMTSTAPFAEQAEETLKINFWGTLNVCKQLFPLLRSDARVVNVSSMAAKFFTSKCNEAAKQQIANCNSLSELEELMTLFVNSARDGSATARGWPESSYGMSKVGVTLLTAITQKEIAKDSARTNVLINCCCPGYVDTDMSSHKGHLTIEEGADTPLFLSLLPQEATGPKGEFYTTRKPAQWM